MKRFIASKGEILAGQGELVTEIEQVQVGIWALEVVLLLQGMSESIMIRSSGNEELVLCLSSAEGKFEKRTVVSRTGSHGIKFKLSRPQAEYLQAVLLRAYRDGMAEVNHVHVEGELEGSTFDLTLLFQKYSPPISPEEAARLLK